MNIYIFIIITACLSITLSGLIYLQLTNVLKVPLVVLVIPFIVLSIVTTAFYVISYLNKSNENSHSDYSINPSEVTFLPSATFWSPSWDPLRRFVGISLVMTRNNFSPTLTISEDFVAIKILRTNVIPKSDIKTIKIVEGKLGIYLDITTVQNDEYRSFFFIKKDADIEQKLRKKLIEKNMHVSDT